MKNRKSDVKWYRLEGKTEKLMAQHGFVPDLARTTDPGIFYVGNISLCSRLQYGDEDGCIEEHEKIKGEPLDQSIACVRCLKRYNEIKDDEQIS